jgi:glycosyltransferase involved in cell wall biosynthesis
LFAALGKVHGKAKLVTTEHNTTNRRRNLPLLKYIDKWIYNRYSYVICISQKAEDNLLAYIKRSNATILTINNGVCLDVFINAKPSSDLEKIAPNAKKIVMVAGFRPQKDQDTLILSMKKLSNDFHLFLIGDGERRSGCESLAKVNGVADRVHFLGLRTDIPNLLKASDYIVMSSHYEGLSLSSVEGMCVGKPFIASNVDGLREVVKGAGLLFEHQDAVGFANLIQQIDKDTKQYRTIADRCLERANQFDISKMVEGYNNIYETIHNAKQ